MGQASPGGGTAGSQAASSRTAPSVVEVVVIDTSGDAADSNPLDGAISGGSSDGPVANGGGGAGDDGTATPSTSEAGESDPHNAPVQRQSSTKGKCRIPK